MRGQAQANGDSVSLLRVYRSGTEPAVLPAIQRCIRGRIVPPVSRQVVQNAGRNGDGDCRRLPRWRGSGRSHRGGSGSDVPGRRNHLRYLRCPVQARVTRIIGLIARLAAAGSRDSLPWPPGRAYAAGGGGMREHEHAGCRCCAVQPAARGFVVMSADPRAHVPGTDSAYAQVGSC
jgi:hypothetical protein